MARRPRPLPGPLRGALPPLLAAWLALAACLPASAGEGDHERARRAVQAGEVMPLPSVLERVAARHPGQVLEVEMEREQGRWVYEIRLLQPDGRLVKLEVDARSAEVLRVRGPGPARR